MDVLLENLLHIQLELIWFSVEDFICRVFTFKLQLYTQFQYVSVSV